MQKSTREPWMPADAYGRSLPSFTVNLLVKEISRSVGFYEKVLRGSVAYWDEDFASIKVAGVEFMLHADHTYDTHPWLEHLASGELRGLGAELRILGIDPDKAEARAREHAANIIQPATDKPHGWREVMVADPDGYVWAVGVSRKG
ncbi:MAG: VOC family protein [Dehalococcoidia bacterium]